MWVQDLRVLIEPQHLVQQDLIAIRPILEVLVIKEEEAAHLGNNKLLMVRSRGTLVVICSANILLYLCDREGVWVGWYSQFAEAEGGEWECGDQ